MSTLTRIQTIQVAYAVEVEKTAQDFGDHEGIKQSKILRWMANFEDSDLGLASKILQEIRYYSSDNIWSMARNLARIVKQQFGSVQWHKVIFVPIGGPYSGSAMIARVLRETGTVNKRSIKYMAELEKMPRSQIEAIVFIDDFCGTGNTLKEWWEVNESIVRPKSVPFAIGLLVMNQTARSVIEGFAKTVLCIDELTDPDNILSSASTRFASGEKTRMVQYCKKTGCHPDYIRGYGNCGLLIAFKHGCPNDSLPILWWRSQSWEPLFKRRGI